MVEGLRNCSLMQSLELRALIRTAIALWNQDDITALTSKFYITFSVFSGRREKWQKIEDKVIEKIQELPLPKSLKKKISDIIKPIGFEILKWISYHEDIMPWSTDTRLVKKILNNLCWTPEGTIDRKETAEALIRDENLHITERYKLACTYCFKNDILMLWNKIPEDHRIYFYNEDTMIMAQEESVVFWTFYAKGELSRICNVVGRKWQECTPYQYAFESAASDGNKVATEYFFQKLTAEEREESLVRAAGYACCACVDLTFVSGEDYAGVLCFLLSQMNEKQQVEVLTNHHFLVLKYLLYWPWQNFFMEMAKRTWTFLPEKGCDILLRLIVNKIKDGFKDYNYHKLFREFWQQSLRTHKEYVIAEFTSGSLLKNLLKIKDKENLKLILENVTSPDREKIIFSYNGKYACEMLLYNDEIDLLEFFVQECISSKDLMIKFREQFGKNVIRYRPEKKVEKEKDKWKKFYRIINDLIQKDDKRRGLEEETSRPAKRLCSLTNE